MFRTIAIRHATRQLSSVSIRRASAQLCGIARVAAATRCVSHSGLSNATQNQLREEQDRSDKSPQPEIPNGWAVSHVAGSSVFRLTKQFGDEELEIRCALPEASGEAQNTGSMNNVVLLVTKGVETMRFGLSIENQELVLDSVSHCNDAAILKNDSSEGLLKQKRLYNGPLIHELDQEIVDEFLSYLDARGVTDELAVFITDFAFWKEQQEYEAWLASISKFTN